MAIQVAKIPACYFVTARHNVIGARRDGGEVCIRMNGRAGEKPQSVVVADWTFHEDVAVDVAVAELPKGTMHAFDISALDERLSDYHLTDDAEGIGIGDALLIIGLFTSVPGYSRLMPVVRSGSIAGVPDDTFSDPMTGGKYTAFLAEMRSSGGLSGSPVFAHLPEARDHRGKIVSGSGFSLIGMIRAHFTGGRADPEVGVQYDPDRNTLNHGIAIITPIRSVVEVLNAGTFVANREALRREQLG